MLFAFILGPLSVANAAPAEPLFKSRCQPCHGPGGKGTGIAPSLVDSQFVRSASEDDIVKTITKGRQGGDRRYADRYPAGMPPQKLSAEEAKEMANYLKSLQGK